MTQQPPLAAGSPFGIEPPEEAESVLAMAAASCGVEGSSMHQEPRGEEVAMSAVTGGWDHNQSQQVRMTKNGQSSPAEKGAAHAETEVPGQLVTRAAWRDLHLPAARGWHTWPRYASSRHWISGSNPV